MTVRSFPLQIRDKDKGLRYGSLLFCYAILEAQEKGCNNVILGVEADSELFYAKFGLIPKEFDAETWDSLSIKQKGKMLTKIFINKFIINYPLRQENLERLQVSLKKALEE